METLIPQSLAPQKLGNRAPSLGPVLIWHFGASGAVKSSIHRGSADLELTDATLWDARRSMGAYPGVAAWAGGSCGCDGGGQPTVRRGGAVSLSHRYAVA